MSYILSALKKAEQERCSGAAPDVLTSQAVAAPARPGGGRKPYFIAAAAVLGLWLVISVLNSGVDTGAVDVSDAGFRSEVRHKAAGQTAEDRPLLEGEPAGRSPERRSGRAPENDGPTPHFGLESGRAAAAQAPAVVTEPAAAPPRTPHAGFAGDDLRFVAPDTARADHRAGGGSVEQWAPARNVLDVAELPPSLRKSLPRLELTGHLYSLAHPHARKVILNGIALKERQYLDDDLRVSEITPDGVILDFHGRLFRLDADQMFR